MSARLAGRMLEYAQERFPLLPSALTAAFLAGAGDALAQPAGRALVVDAGFALTCATVLALLFLLRVCDEHKDQLKVTCDCSRFLFGHRAL